MCDVETLLRDRIQSGHYEVGTRLPSEREICDELKVHRRIVRSAIQVLEREGLVSRRPNCRAIVGTSDLLDELQPPVTQTSRQHLSKFVALMMYHGTPQEEGGTLLR